MMLAVTIVLNAFQLNHLNIVPLKCNLLNYHQLYKGRPMYSYYSLYRKKDIRKSNIIDFT